jgi:glycosyltransferase involved in cell wall biosynthesis
MNIFHHPAWINDLEYPFQKYEEIPASVFDSINNDLRKLKTQDPVVSIVIAAWNEEVNILRCVASLAKTQTQMPIEIIVVNNNSTDNTQKTLDRLNITALFEATQGCGPARQLGQETAKGKYILLADADCFYPACWVDEMVNILKEENVVCVYGRYSFIDEPGFPRWKLSIFEAMKDVMAEIRQLNRPYYNTYGLSMGYVREYGLKVGFIKTNFWGDDGQLCLGLMDYGKVKPVRSNKARVWTGTRTLQRSGNFSQALTDRIKKEANRFFKNFDSKLPDNARMKTK